MREILSVLRFRLLALRKRRQLDRDLREEIAFHLALLKENNSERRFGNPVLVKEDLREMWTFRGLETWWQDVRYAARKLRKNPVFTLVAVLSLAIGIGGNTAVFSLADAIMLRSLPVRDPGRLRLVYWKGTVHMPAGSNPRTAAVLRDFHRTIEVFSQEMYRQIASTTPQFSDLAAFGGQSPYPIRANGSAHVAMADFVSGNFFGTLGIDPATGRILGPQDDRRGAQPVAVISYAYWNSHFGLNPKAVGSTITVNGKDVVLVGVAPKGFKGVESGYPNDLFLTLSSAPGIDNRGKALDPPDSLWLELIGRLRPGVTDQQAFQGLGTAMDRVDDSASGGAGKREPWLPEIHPGGAGTLSLRANQSDNLRILGGAAGFVLLIACVNLANLLLARDAGRRREIAVRLSIGASRSRVMRQLLTESLLIAVLGAGVGLAIAHPLAEKIVDLAGGLEPVTIDTGLDARAILFAAAVTIATTILFGVLPALRGTRLNLTPALKQGPGATGIGGGKPQLSRVLLSGQVALSTVLLAGAVLFVRTLVNLDQVKLGFAPENLLVFRVDGKGAGYKAGELARVYDRILGNVVGVPGIKSATLMGERPFAYGGMRSLFTVSGHSEPSRAFVNMVGSGFMHTMAVTLLAGRDIDDRDVEGAPLVAIVNETFVRTYMKGENAIGSTLSWSIPGDKSDSKDILHIVAVCADMHYNNLRKEIPPTVFLAYRQNPKSAGAADIAVRTALPPGSVTQAVLGAVAAADREIPVAEVRTEQAQIGMMIGPERLLAGLAGSFASVAALLVAIGLYGLMSYIVTSRTSEIGIRVALGARQNGVLWMVLREGLILTAIGMAIGIPTAMWMAKFVAKRLFGTGPADPSSYGAAALLMMCVAALAAWIPARRASQVDPAVALRGE
jgi:macrolide transport system ATP-binding/permease protein